jgi:hypothetical protein
MVFPHQRSGPAEGRVINFMVFSPELLNQLANVQSVPGDHSIVQHGQTTEGMQLIPEFAPAQRALLTKAQKAGRVVGGLTFV